jgi:hypothetical protein
MEDKMRLQILDVEQKVLNLGTCGNIGDFVDYTNNITGESDPRFVFKINPNRWLHLSTLKDSYSAKFVKDLDTNEIKEL